MMKPPTGEPCAGEPHARFGGRGGRESFPTPIMSFWLGVLAPAQTPPALVKALFEAIKSSAEVPAVRVALLQQGDIMMFDPQQFAARIRRETEDNAATIKRAGITLE